MESSDISAYKRVGILGSCSGIGSPSMQRGPVKIIEYMLTYIYIYSILAMNSQAQDANLAKRFETLKAHGLG